MKILVFGGVGHIGANISLEGRKQGYEIVAFDNLVRTGVEKTIPVLEKAGVEIIRGDIRCREDLSRLPLVDGIINLAANPGVPISIRDPLYDFNENMMGFMNVLEYARERNIPVILASTNKVYSELINDIPYTETDTRYVWSQSRDG